MAETTGLLEERISARGNVFMMDRGELLTRAFTVLGLRVPPKGSIRSDIALQAIDCLARSCLPIIGEHCQDIITLHEEQNRTRDDEIESDSAERKIAALDVELEQLRGEHKRLLAHRNIDSATETACQGATDAYNQAAQSLLNIVSLMATVRSVENSLRSLEDTPVPELKRPSSSELTSLPVSTGSRMEPLDDVARFSIQNSIRDHVYDCLDNERPLTLLRDMLTGMSERLKDVEVVQARPSPMLVRILAHAHVIKNVLAKASEIANSTERLRPAEVESITAHCIEIIKSRQEQLSEFDFHSATEVDDDYELMTLQDRRNMALDEIVTLASDLETLEDQLRSMCDEFHAAVENLRSFDHLVDVARLQRMVRQSTKLQSTLFPRKLRPDGRQQPESIARLSGELERLTEVIRSQNVELATVPDNRDAFEYLSALERSQDLSGITAVTLSAPKMDIESFAEELMNFEVLRLAKAMKEYDEPISKLT